MRRRPQHAQGFTAAAVVALVAMAGCVTGEPASAPSATGAFEWTVFDEQRLTPNDVSASEVSIAADPTDPDHLVAAANSAGGFGVYVTRDAGATWESQIFPAARVAPNPTGAPRFLGLSDPVVAFGADGAVYVGGLSIIPTSGVFVARSDDGGTTWNDGVIVHESDLAASFNDKEWMGVHPQTGTIIMAWQKEPLLDSLRSVEAQTGIDADIGDIVYSRSTDNGATWSLPMRVSRGLHNNGSQVAFTPDGRAHLLWVNYEQESLDYSFSDDDGVSWSTPKAVTDAYWVPPFERYSRMHTLPGLAATPSADSLFATWHDSRNGDSDVYVVASHDSGATWSNPVRVTTDAVDSGIIQFYPWVAADAEGGVHVTLYDARDDPECPLFRFIHAYSDDGGATFAETGAVSEPFTAFSGSECGNQFQHTLGDYTGVAATPSGIFPAWADGRDDRVGVWSMRISPP